MLQSLVHTNDFVEGWHSRFSGRAQSSHLNLWLFIELSRKVQGSIKLKIERVSADSGTAVVRKKKYRNVDNRILNNVQLHSKTNTLEY